MANRTQNNVKPATTSMYSGIRGMLSTLDPHSVFLPPESSKKMEEDNEGEFGGLGITINEAEVRKHPFQQELPQRVFYSDGSVGDW